MWIIMKTKQADCFITWSKIEDLWKPIYGSVRYVHPDFDQARSFSEWPLSMEDAWIYVSFITQSRYSARAQAGVWESEC